MIDVTTSSDDDKAGNGHRDAAAVALFEVISKDLPGFFITLVAKFLPALAEILPNFSKKLPGCSACIVLSLTVIDFFLLLVEQSAN